MLYLFCSNLSTFTQTVPYIWNCILNRMSGGALFREERQWSWLNLPHTLVYILLFSQQFVQQHSCQCWRSGVWNLHQPSQRCLLFYCNRVWENILNKNIFFSDNFKTKFDKVLLKSSDLKKKNAKFSSSTSVLLHFFQDTNYNYKDGNLTIGQNMENLVFWNWAVCTTWLMSSCVRRQRYSRHKKNIKCLSMGDEQNWTSENGST